MTTFIIQVNGEIRQIEGVSNYQELKQRIQQFFPALNDRVWNAYYQFDGDKISIDNQNDFQNMIDGIQDQKISNAEEHVQNRILYFEDADTQKQSVVERYENNKENECELKSHSSENEERMKFDAQLNATYAISQIKSFEQPTNNLTESTHNLLMFIQDKSLANHKEQAESEQQQKIQPQQANQKSQVDRNCERINISPQESDQVQSLFQKKPIKNKKNSNMWERILDNQNGKPQIEEQVPKDSVSKMPNLQNFDVNSVNTEKMEQIIIYQSELKQDDGLNPQKHDAYVQTKELQQIEKYAVCVVCGKSQKPLKMYLYMHSCILCEICNGRWNLQPKARPFTPEEKI